MSRRANRGHQHLCRVAVVAQDVHELSDHRDAVVTDVVEAPDEGRKIGRAALGRREPLQWAEYQRHVDPDAAVAERARGLQSLDDERALDHYVGMEVREALSLLEHRGRLARYDLGADRPVHD